MGRHVVLSFVGASGAKFLLELIGVERILVTEMRQQNIMEAMTHWVRGSPSDGLREAAFALMTGVDEKDCAPALLEVVQGVIDRVARGELSMIETHAIFGAQILATFSSMVTRPV
jgi:hypothetical protein